MKKIKPKAKSNVKKDVDSDKKFNRMERDHAAKKRKEQKSGESEYRD